MRNFRQVLSNIEVEPLLGQVDQHPELWSKETEWTRKGNSKLAIYDTENIVLRYNQPRLPPRLASLPRDAWVRITRAWQDDEWNKPALEVLPAARKIIKDLMAAIPGDHLGKIVLTRLRPGETIPWHIDALPPGWNQYWHRFQIPLRVNPGVRFVVGEEEQYLEPGTAWWFNNQTMHAVFNNSTEDRISMLTDIAPGSSVVR
jgi:hypothetical protein